jgi:hypothetical protein
MTQLLANLADHGCTYVNVMHCLHLVLFFFDPARSARGGIDYPRSLSVGSVENRPTSSVLPAASHMAAVCALQPYSLALRNSLMPGLPASSGSTSNAFLGVFPSAIDRDILLACAPSDSSGHPYGLMTVHNLDQRYSLHSFLSLGTAHYRK